MTDEQRRERMTPRELTAYVARALAEHPDEVRIRESTSPDGLLLLELAAHPADLPRLIGRQGAIVNALRHLLAVGGAREGYRIRLEIPDARAPQREGGPPAPRR